MFALYAWISSYCYLAGFYNRFNTDPEQLGFERVDATGRTLAIAIPLLFIWAFTLAMVLGATGWVIALGYLGIERASRRWRKRSLTGQSLTWRSLPHSVMSQAIAWLCVTVFLLFAVIFPYHSYEAGFTTADRILSSARWDVAPSSLQFVVGPRVEAYEITWHGPTPPPFHRRGSQAPEATAQGYLLAEYNGVTHFFNTDDCTIYHLPSSSVSLSRGVGQPARSSPAGQPVPSKLTC